MLNEIIANKRKELNDIPENLPIRSKNVLNPVSYLRRNPFIAEVKKASPSAGNINTEISPLKQATEYEKHGAGAISVLTDKKFFKGSFEYLREIAENVSIPVLCKDFIISPRQIETAYAYGADFILLIASILETNEIEVLSEKAHKLGLKVLYEIHKMDEFRKIKHLSPEIIGVNSRNLDTLSIDKNKASEILTSLNGKFLKIAESGINDQSDIVNFREAGADAFLVGTYLMKSKSIAESFQKLYGGLK